MIRLILFCMPFLYIPGITMAATTLLILIQRYRNYEIMIVIMMIMIVIMMIRAMENGSNLTMMLCHRVVKKRRFIQIMGVLMKTPVLLNPVQMHIC